MTPEQLKASILQRAMEGKLVPQDPNDEPASELLKRIKSEKEKLIKEGKIKRDKNETEIFRGDDGLHYEKFADGTVKEVEVPFDIPESWEWTNLQSISNKIFAGGDKPKAYSDTKTETFSIPIYANGAKNDGLFGYTDVPRVIEKALTVSGRGTIGFSVVRNEPFVPIVRLLVITANENWISLDYLKYYFSYLIPTGEGTSIQQLTVPKIKPSLIPLPPIKEQIRIVSKIEEMITQVQSYATLYLREKKIRTEFPEKLRKSILQYAMQGKLVPQDPNDEPVDVLLEKIRQEKQKLFEEGKLKKKDLQESIIYKGDDNSYYKNIPDAWISTTLGNIGVWGAGATPSRSNPKYYGGDIPWLKTGDLTDGLVTDIPEHITELALAKTSVKLNPTNSVLIAMYGATIGKLGILTFPATTNQACCACQPIPAVNNWFLFYYLMSIRKQFIDSAEGGAQPNISRIKIVNTPFPMPTYAEQVKIVGLIEKSFDLVSQLLQ